MSVEEAIALHGPDADVLEKEKCWNPTRCHRKRSHYRNREDVNRSRRRIRRSGKQGESEHLLPVEEGFVRLLSLPDSSAYAAVLVLYRNHKDSPVHAIGAEIWQGDRKVMSIHPVHCMGMRGNDVTAYIQKVLTQLKEMFGVSRFEDVIKELPVSDCPIDPCPFKSQ